jgi:hypothetical protein
LSTKWIRAGTVSSVLVVPSRSFATVKGEYVYKGTGFLAAPIALVDGEYVYKGSTKLGGPIANISGGGRMSAAAAAVFLLLM